MIKEFEGKTEEEAIAKAIAELNIGQEDVDIEILPSERRPLFKKPPVRIRVHLDDKQKDKRTDRQATGFEEEVIGFLTTLLEKMGYPGTVTVGYRKQDKIGLVIDSEYSPMIIGRKGKNLDAIQLIVNVFASRLQDAVKVIIDSENYRMRHEEQLVRLAYRAAEQVKQSGKSKLLEPMNPFERRLVHTVLNDIEGITTISEGEGLLKQVRILPDDEVPPLRSN